MVLDLNDLRALATGPGIRIVPLADRDGLELQVSGAAGPLRVAVWLEGGGRLVRLLTIGYLYAGIHPGNSEDARRGLAALNERLPHLRLALDPREGEIVVAADIDVPEGLSETGPLRALLRNALDLIDRLRPGLIQAAKQAGLDLAPERIGPAKDPGTRLWLAALARARGQTKKFASTPYTPDAVDCAVFSQREARAGDSVLVQVFAYMPGYEGEAGERALEYDEEAKKLGGASLDTEILRGSALTFELTFRDIVVPDAVQSFVWRGRTQSVQFEVPVPADSGARNLIGRVLVSQATVPIGQVLFKIKVLGGAEAADRTSLPAGDAQRYRQAFISYASKDRPEVLRRVQMLSTVGIRYFQDVFDLEPGDRWAQKLYEQIDQSNVMFLFWSTAARESEWVKREWQYGLKAKGEDFIHPVIIEGPPAPEPPPELAHVHFADRMLYFINARG